MSNEKVVLAVVCWICALIFGTIGLWAFKRKDQCTFGVEARLGLKKSQT